MNSTHLQSAAFRAADKNQMSTVQRRCKENIKLTPRTHACAFTGVSFFMEVKNTSKNAVHDSQRPCLTPRRKVNCKTPMPHKCRCCKTPWWRFGGPSGPEVAVGEDAGVPVYLCRRRILHLYMRMTEAAFIYKRGTSAMMRSISAQSLSTHHTQPSTATTEKWFQHTTGLSTIPTKSG